MGCTEQEIFLHTVVSLTKIIYKNLMIFYHFLPIMHFLELISRHFDKFSISTYIETYPISANILYYTFVVEHRPDSNFV